MRDFYSERLGEARKTKEARLQKLVGLPIGAPPKTQNGETATSLKTMASSPTDPNAKPDMQDGMFKNIFDNYSKDPSFKSTTNEFATIMNAMKSEVEGLGLPEEILKKKVMGVIDQFKNKARGPQVSEQPSAMGDLAPQENAQGGMF